MSALRTAISNWLYDKGPGRYYQPTYAQIARSTEPQQGAFLDVGCGPGWLSVHVARGRPDLDVVGIDLSARMVRYAERNAAEQLNITFRQMDAGSIKYAEGTFHGAAAVQSAHHWTHTPEILAEVHRVLAPGASFSIYEADRAQREIPEGWIERTSGWPPDALVRLGWRRFGMDDAEWEELMMQAEASPFQASLQERFGFYRRLVLTK